MLTKEELNNKYIKYILEINEEIFNEIIDKLENLGFVHGHNFSRKEEYVFFKNKYPYLRISDEKKQWKITKSNVECEEIQVSDILDENWSNFEVGGWYKLDNWISKFKRLEADYKFWGENINTKTGFIDDKGWLDLKFYKPIKLSIEEVQQYLPEGHADKIKKWSVGSYIVPLQNKLLTRTEPLTKGKPYEIIENSCVPYILDDTHRRINFVDKYNPEEKEGIRWFPTLKEAEAFSKELLETKKDDICETCNGEGTVMTAKLYPNGHTEVTEDCPDCNGLGYIEEESKPLTVDDLIKGEIYFYTFIGFCDHIVEYDGNYSAKYNIAFNHVNGHNPNFLKNTYSNSSFTDGTLKKGSLRLATPEEKQWLKVCIAEGKFIKKDDALKDHDMYSKALTVDDLVEEEVYFAEFDKEEWSSLFYCKTPSMFTVRLYVSDKYTGKRYDPGNWTFTEGVNYRLATPEEKRWLHICIAENKFIEKDYALRGYDMDGKALKSEIDETFKEGTLIKGEFYNLPGYAIFEAGKKGYIGSGGRDWRAICDNNWAGPENFVPATPLEKKWVITCRKQNKFIEKSELNKYDDEGNLIEMKMTKCVITTTQEEWDFCLSKCDQSSRLSKCNDKFKQWSKPYPEGIAVCIENNSYCGVNWFKNNGYEVISFQEFLNLNGYTFEEENKLENRYIKYDETFTEDMFNYMLDWAKKQNFPGKPYNMFDNTFDSFKIKEHFWFSCHTDYCYGVDNNPQTCTEITFKELFPEYKLKEMESYDLKNPVFNIGDKVRVIADSLKEFNSSWSSGNNTDYKKGYEGLITGIDKTKSNYGEVNTWCYLDGSSEAMSCNLLELVEPAKKEFDRNWYVKVNNQEEADLVFNWLRAQGEPVINTDECLKFRVNIDKCINYWKEENTWFVNNKPEKNTYQKQLSDILPNYSSESKIDRNIYYEVNNQKEYCEIMIWLKTIGEPVTSNYFHVTGYWRYIIYDDGRWTLSTKHGSRVKEDYCFKNDKPSSINISPSPSLRVIHYEPIINEKHEVKIINVPKI